MMPAVDEGRKHVIGIMAAILASLDLRTADDLFGTSRHQKNRGRNEHSESIGFHLGGTIALLRVAYCDARRYVVEAGRPGTVTFS
jgi:hypothetical protein